MNLYQQRWNNAVRIHKMLMKLQEDGYIIFDEKREVVGKLIITDDALYFEKSANHRIVFCINDPQSADGLELTIGEYNKLFESWTCIQPSDLHKIVV